VGPAEASVRGIKRVFGKVHVNFGEPLALAEFLDAQHPAGARKATREPPWARAATRDAAAELADGSTAAVINPVNLMALALLATPKHTADEHALRAMIEHYQALPARRRMRRPASPACWRRADRRLRRAARSSSALPTRSAT
jgi:glycerol-3-phosphate O-acyltransferase